MGEGGEYLTGGLEALRSGRGTTQPAICWQVVTLDPFHHGGRMICPCERCLFAFLSEILLPAHLCVHGMPASPACCSTQLVSDQGSRLRVTHSRQQIWCLCKCTSLTTCPYPRSSLEGALKLLAEVVVPVGQENQSSVLQDAAGT